MVPHANRRTMATWGRLVMAAALLAGGPALAEELCAPNGAECVEATWESYGSAPDTAVNLTASGAVEARVAWYSGQSGDYCETEIVVGPVDTDIGCPIGQAPAPLP